MSETRWIGRKPTLSRPRPKSYRRRIPSRIGRGFACALLAITLAACGSSAGSPTPGPTTASPVPTASPAPTAAATETPSLAETSVPTETPTLAPTPTAKPTAGPSANGHFSLTGAMAAARSGHTATLLQDGRVLIAGGHGEGVGGPALKSAELYDPATGKFTPTGSMAVARDVHSATLLPDGRVLIAGGYAYDLSLGYPPLASAELYEPKTGTFSPTGSMGTARAFYAAVGLTDGRVLIAGGMECEYGALVRCEDLDSAELYDPTSGTFSPTGSMGTPRAPDSAARLSDGRVLIVGGIGLASAELYDPSTGTFSSTGSMAAWRWIHTATTLRNGRVLVAGGELDGDHLASAELYDPGTGRFSPTGSMIDPHFHHTATLLTDGRVLITGGGWGRRCYGAVCYPGIDFRSAEVYDPGTGRFVRARPMNAGRSNHTATLLHDGRVLIAGGEDGGEVGQSSAELFSL